MRTKAFLAIPLVFVTLTLTSCWPWGWDSSNPSAQKTTKDLSAYKTLFSDTFVSYQTATTEVPKKGIFDFEFTTNVDGDEKKLASFAWKSFGEAFNAFSLKLGWEYNFENLEKPSLSTTLKTYLNKANTGLWDLDMEASIDASNSLVYEIRNLDAKLLRFFEIDEQTIAALVKMVEANKGKKQKTALATNLLQEVIASVKETGKDSPLYENSKEEEKKIIEAFVKSETIEVYSGSWVNDTTERIAFKFNPKNFSNFLNETAKILWKWNENKDFSEDAKLLAETVRIEGTLDIKDKRIIDSQIQFVMRLGGVDEKTKEKKSDDLVAKIRFAFPNPSRFDVDIDTQLYANSSPDNVLRLRIKWLIK